MPINAIHVGMPGFPAGSASINKCIAVYQSLGETSVKVLAINNRAFHRKDVYFKIEKNGKINGIEYLYTTPSPFKSNSFLGRRTSNFKGKLNEFLLLLKLGFQNKIDLMFFYPNGSFLWLVYYRIFSLLFNFPIISHYVEYRSAFKSRKSKIDKISDYLFDNYFFKFVDAILPISEYLIQHLKEINCRKPFIKIPPLTNFKDFEKLVKTDSANYFLYVGSASYLEAISLVTESFAMLEAPSFELHLIVNGNTAEMKTLSNILLTNKNRDSIKVFSKLSYQDLLQKYVNASANLIPLSSSIQDTARFPQKIAEYLASGNVIITTANGEVPFYFTDKENALIAEAYTAEAIAEQMKFVIENPQEALQIGRAGHQLGLKYFDTNSIGERLKELISQVKADDLVLE